MNNDRYEDFESEEDDRKHMKALDESFNRYQDGSDPHLYMDLDDIIDLYGYYFNHGAIHQATNLLSFGRLLYPNTPELDIRLAHSHLAHNKLAEAEAICKDLEDRSVPDPEIVFLRAMILGQQDKGKEAIDMFLSLTGSFEELDVIYHNVSNEYERQGLFDEALDYARKAYVEDVDNIQSIDFLCYKYISYDRIQSGIHFISEQTERYPMNEYLWSSLSWLYFKDQAYDEAIDAINNAVALNEEEVIFQHRKLLYLSSSNLYQEAITLVNHLLEETPESISLLLKKGVLMESQGDLEGSLPFFAHAVALSQYLPSVVIRYASVLLQLEQFGTARKAIEHAAEIHQGDSSIIRSLGVFYMLYVGDKPSALTCIRESLDKITAKQCNKILSSLLRANWHDEAVQFIDILVSHLEQSVDKSLFWPEYVDAQWSKDTSGQCQVVMSVTDLSLPVAILQLVRNDQAGGYRNLLRSILYDANNAALYSLLFSKIIDDPELDDAIACFMDEYVESDDDFGFNPKLIFDDDQEELNVDGDDDNDILNDNLENYDSI